MVNMGMATGLGSHRSGDHVNGCLACDRNGSECRLVGEIAMEVMVYGNN